jgi:hypothetical protein
LWVALVKIEAQVEHTAVVVKPQMVGDQDRVVVSLVSSIAEQHLVVDHLTDQQVVLWSLQAEVAVAVLIAILDQLVVVRVADMPVMLDLPIMLIITVRVADRTPAVPVTADLVVLWVAQTATYHMAVVEAVVGMAVAQDSTRNHRTWAEVVAVLDISIRAE